MLSYLKHKREGRSFKLLINHMLYFNRTKVTSVIIVLLLLVAISVFLISFRYNPNKPNVILITIDALRADHLSCYGYKRQTSINIDTLMCRIKL